MSHLIDLFEPHFPASRLRRDASLAPMTTFRIGGPADLIVRAHYVDIDYSNLNFNSPSSLSDDGYSIEVGVAGRISDRADVFASYEYTDLSDVGNRDVRLGLNYVVWAGLSVVAQGIVFDSREVAVTKISHDNALEIKDME